jgi:hypothetical protein
MELVPIPWPDGPDKLATQAPEHRQKPLGFIAYEMHETQTNNNILPTKTIALIFLFR